MTNEKRAKNIATCYNFIIITITTFSGGVPMRGRYFHVGDADFKSEEGEAFKLLYYITVDGAAYCIKIERVGADGSLTMEESKGLSFSYEEIEALAKTFMDGAVTPTHLHDLVDDFIG